MTPVVNDGLQRTRDLIRGSGTMNQAVDSVGIGTNDAAEAASDVALGNGGTAAKQRSYWKSSTDVTKTSGGDGTADPWWQFEITFTTGEANDANPFFEIGTAAGAQTGAPQTTITAQNGKLYTRKRIGGSGGITKTSDIELVVRVRTTY